VGGPAGAARRLTGAGDLGPGPDLDRGQPGLAAGLRIPLTLSGPRLRT
jgi:hypothetical protein